MDRRQVVGLLPAAGEANRVSPLPCSKELYPVGVGFSVDQKTLRPKGAAQYLLEKMQRAGVANVYVILRRGKWDIPGYFGNGRSLDLNIAYRVLSSSFGTPYTLDEAYPFVQHSLVAFGFPDILFDPDDAFVRLLARQAQTDACAILGLFPAERPQKVDMVDFAQNGQVRQILSKPHHTELSHSWCIAVWTPVFTNFLHSYVAEHQSAAAAGPELSVGNVLQAAVESGLHIDAIPVSDTPYLDIGTPEDLVRAVRRYTHGA
jgi:glucose-1-phosphate thymidylyltransferase